jgi:hypothetical protein
MTNSYKTFSLSLIIKNCAMHMFRGENVWLHSCPRHEVELSGQLYSPPGLPAEKEPPIPRAGLRRRGLPVRSMVPIATDQVMLYMPSALSQYTFFGALAFFSGSSPLKYSVSILWTLSSNYFIFVSRWADRLYGLVVRVLGYRSGGPGSIPGTTRKKSNGSGTGSAQPREYNWGATW